jgi:hypothetical protein
MNEGTNANWPAIIAIAVKADGDSGANCRKRGAQSALDLLRIRKVRARGYHGIGRRLRNYHLSARAG